MQIQNILPIDKAHENKADSASAYLHVNADQIRLRHISVLFRSVVVTFSCNTQSIPAKNDLDRTENTSKSALDD